jgi:hypothetical protein
MVRRPDLLSDCASCAALCCVATSFAASEDFAFDKPAGVACRFLTQACRCAIHDARNQRGLSGCTSYDCYGAGPRVTRAFAGACDSQRNEVFLSLRVVHELLWLLSEARKLCPDTHAELAALLVQEIGRLDSIACDAALPEQDLRPQCEAARALLRRVGDALGGRSALRVRMQVVG